MKTITLENGKKVAISEESYKALEDAVREVTWEDVWEWAKDEGETDVFQAVRFGREHQEKIKAIHRLLIVAKYLNGDWKPDWEDRSQVKWSLYIDEDKVDVVHATDLNDTVAYFKTEEAALRAISILGEETIRTAFSTDW